MGVHRLPGHGGLDAINPPFLLILCLSQFLFVLLCEFL